MVRRSYTPAALILLSLASLFLLQAGSAEPSDPAAQPSAAVGVPVLQSHTFREYNDNIQAWTLLQDRSGLMYAGISGGNILQYDGVTWRKIFTTMSVIRSL